MTGRFANIIVDISHENVDRPFQYRIPEELRGQLAVGMAVMIPFGRGNKLIQGYVMEITDRIEYDEEKLKAVNSIVKDSISAQNDSMKLAWWIKENYGSTMIAALKTVLPVKKKLKQVVKKTIVCKVDAGTAAEKADEFESKHQKAKARLMRELATQPVLPHTLVTGKLNIAAQTIQALQKAGLIEVQTEDTYRNALPKNISVSDAKKLLSDNQSRIVNSIAADFRAGVRQTYLVHGVTGSGKTEVYMALIERVI
ncbi:MAG: primosomal protein N', partial [Lachnospiraceae bacterium]|nr:primosomal protein N' [Lachnospiraceae bacterium]